jgi:hypothetical protein
MSGFFDPATRCSTQRRVVISLVPHITGARVRVWVTRSHGWSGIEDLADLARTRSAFDVAVKITAVLGVPEEGPERVEERHVNDQEQKPGNSSLGRAGRSGLENQPFHRAYITAAGAD